MNTAYVFANLPSEFVEALAALVAVVIIGKVTRSESRLLMASVAGLLVFPYPAILWSVALLGVFLRALDFVNLPVGGR